MDWTQIVVGVIALVGSLGGSIIGMFLNQKLTIYRMEQLEKQAEKIPEIEAQTQAIKSELDSFTVNASERRKMVEDIESDVERLKSELNDLTTRVALIENEIKMYHKHIDG